jgi:ABC-type molybdenum transport system ATPase subunit/photorepair protein PhrA
MEIHPGRSGDGTDPKPSGEADLPPLHTITLQQFAAVKEEGGKPLLGDRDQVLIPEDGDVMIYGDGGAGKTTLAIDLAIHWAGNGA